MTKRYIGCLVVASFALMVMSPVWAQSSSSELSERIRSTLKAAPPGLSRTDDNPRQPLRAEPMEQPEQVEQLEQTEPATASDQGQSQRQERMDAAAMPQSCKNLQVEIDNKIRANDVVNYTVTVLPTPKANEVVARNRNEPGKVEIVGNCGQGDYQVVYRRG